jgi:serine/threonine protein kinase/tetratricopeptide (TPR) repeat protein
MAESSSEQIVEVLLEEFILSVEEGKAPSVDEFASRAGPFAELFRQRAAAFLKANGLFSELGRVAAPTQGLPPAPKGYRIIREIGRGGMGTVYLAEQPALQRKVAVKVLHAHHAVDDAHVQRFLREGKAIASLQHDHIVRVIDVIPEEGRLYLVLEHVPGVSLGEALSRLKTDGLGALSPRTIQSATEGRDETRRYGKASYYAQAAAVVRDVADALHHAHAQGIIHRDVKPSNILLDEKGKPFLADFGLARMADAEAVTQSRSLLGTPHYLAPEQISGNAGEVSARTDVYALGITLYECLTLSLPYQGDTPAKILHAILHAQPAAIRKVNKEVPRDLEVIAQTAMARLLKDRYATAAALRDDLDAFLEHRAILARPLSVALRIGRGIRRQAWRVALAAAIVLLVMFGYRQWETVKRREAEIETGRLRKVATARRVQEDRAFDKAVLEALFYMGTDETKWREAMDAASRIRSDPFLELLEWAGTLLKNKAAKGTQGMLPEDTKGSPLGRILSKANVRDETTHAEILDRIREAVTQGLISPREGMLIAILDATPDQLPAAKKLGDQAIALAPNDPVVLGLAATLFGRIGEQGAARLISMAMNLRPDVAVLYLAIIPQLEKSAEYDRRREVINTGLARFPEDLPLLQEAARISEMQWDFEEVIQYLQKALQHHPKAVQLVYPLGRAYAELGRFDSLKDLIEQYEENPDAEVLTKLLRAVLYTFSPVGEGRDPGRTLEILREIDFSSKDVPLNDTIEYAVYTAWQAGDPDLAHRIAKSLAALDWRYSLLVRAVEASVRGAVYEGKGFRFNPPGGWFERMGCFFAPLGSENIGARLNVFGSYDMPLDVTRMADSLKFYMEGTKGWLFHHRGQGVDFQLVASESCYSNASEAVTEALRSLRFDQFPHSYQTMDRFWVDEFHGVSFPVPSDWTCKSYDQTGGVAWLSASIDTYSQLGVALSCFPSDTLEDDAISLEDKVFNLVGKPVTRTDYYAGLIDREIVSCEWKNGDGKYAITLPGIIVEHQMILVQNGNSMIVLTTGIPPREKDRSKIRECLFSVVKGMRFMPPNRTLPLLTLGCEIDLPEGWLPTDDGSKADLRQFSFYPADDRVGVSVERFPTARSAANLREFLIQRSEMFAKDLEILHEERRTSDHGEEIWGEVSYEDLRIDGGRNIRSWIRVLPMGDAHIFLEGYAEPGLFDGHKDTLEKILQSFRLYDGSVGE